MEAVVVLVLLVDLVVPALVDLVDLVLQSQ
jgi:hypothetical protein